MTERALILTPYYGGADFEHISCIGNLIQLGWRQATILNCALLDHAFGALAGMALRQELFDMVLFIEHDIIFTPGEAVDIVQAAREADAMVGAPCPIKNPRGKIMVSGLQTDTLTFGEKGKLEPCWGLPFGFTAMPLHWLRKVCDHFCPEGPCRADNGGDVWPVFSCSVKTATDGHRELMTQDYSFCEKLDAIGCPRYLDTRRRIVHKGSYPYTIEDCCWSVPLVDDLQIRFVAPEQIEPINNPHSLGHLEATGDVSSHPAELHTCRALPSPRP